MNKKEQIEIGIRKAQEDVKKFPDHTLLVNQLYDMEETYRYHYEGGKVPVLKTNVSPTVSKDEVWVGCKTCPWERHEHQNEEVNEAECDNCGSKETYVYPITERKKRIGKSFIDGKDLGGTGNGGNKCKGGQCTSNKPPVYIIPDTNIPLCEECKELFDSGTINIDGRFFTEGLSLLCINDCGLPIPIKCEKGGVCTRPPRTDFVCGNKHAGLGIGEKTIAQVEEEKEICLERQKKKFEELNEKTNRTVEEQNVLERLSRRLGKPITSDDSKRERERERRISQLRTEIR